MSNSFQALFFVTFLVLSISTSNLVFAQSYNSTSNNTKQLKPVGISPAIPKCQAEQISVGNVCLSTEAACPLGFTLRDGQICIFSKPSCPSGSVSGNGGCTLIKPICNIEMCRLGASILSCPGGTELFGMCVLTSEIQPTPPIICPEGFGFQDNSCVPSSTLSREGCPNGTVLQNGVCVASSTQSAIMLSPLQQFKSGISVYDVKCKQGLFLVMKTSDNSPACAKLQTAQKLVERGWAKEIVSRTSETTTLPASFMPCNTPFPQSNSGVGVLYMPVNSIGKICVRYSNYNDFPVEPIYGISIVDPNNSYQKASGITIWNDLGNNPILKENSTVVVYWIKTGNQTGFYELTVPSCVGTPFAVGYDNNSKIVSRDFPFVGVTVSCPAMLYGSDIDSLTGIGVKYIPYP